MIGHLRVKSPLSQLGIFLGLFGGAFILGTLLMAVVALIKGIPIASLEKMDFTEPAILSTMKWIQAISSLVMFLGPALLFAVIVFNGRPLYFLGLRPPPELSMYALAAICVILAFPFVFWLGQLNQHIPLPKWMTGLEQDATKQIEAFLKAENTGDVAINVLVIALLPAICEEICFRGVLQRILINVVKHPWTGIILTAIFFSALHFQFQGFLPRMFLGMILGALYWYSGSLWTSILAHFVTNAIQVIAFSYAPEYVSNDRSIPPYLALVSGIAVLAVLLIYKKKSTITYAKVYETEELNRHNQFLS